jgi:uncharacterized delta-60 repeat protein
VRPPSNRLASMFRAPIRTLATLWIASVYVVQAYGAAGDHDLTFGTQGSTLTSFSGVAAAEANGLAIQADGKSVLVGACTNFDPGHTICIARYNTDGTLDTSFSTDGKVRFAFPGLERSSAESVAIQADGKIIVAGTCTRFDDVTVACVARYTDTGLLDDTFGDGGMVTTSLISDFDRVVFGVALQRSGKIIVGGSCDDFMSFLGIITWMCATRFNSDGTIDTGFGHLGTARARLTSAWVSEAYTLVVQADDKVVLAGRCIGPESQFCLARFTANGGVDTQFGSSGVVYTTMQTPQFDVGSGFSVASGVAIQSDKKIVVSGLCGGTNADGGGRFCLARYQSNGALDTSFSGDGKVFTSMADPINSLTSMALQRDGKIVVASNCAEPEVPSQTCAVRYHATGRIDQSFASSGKLLKPLCTGFTGGYMSAIALQGDGKILLAGGCDRRFSVTRFEDE